MKRLLICVILGLVLLIGSFTFVSRGWADERDVLSFVTRKDRGHSIQLINTRGEFLQTLMMEGSIAHFTWSPDGHSIAYSSNRNGDPDIYVIDVKTNMNRRLTFDDGRNWWSSWSPSAKWIAYLLIQLPEILPEGWGLAEEFFANSVICVANIADVGGGEPIEATRRLVSDGPEWVPSGFLAVSPSVEKQITLWGALKQSEDASK